MNIITRKIVENKSALVVATVITWIIFLMCCFVFYHFYVRPPSYDYVVVNVSDLSDDSIYEQQNVPADHTNDYVFEEIPKTTKK